MTVALKFIEKLDAECPVNPGNLNPNDRLLMRLSGVVGVALAMVYGKGFKEAEILLDGLESIMIEWALDRGFPYRDGPQTADDDV